MTQPKAKRGRANRTGKHLPTSPAHPCLNCYTAHGCRCGSCKALHVLHDRAQRADRIKRGQENPDLIPHGGTGYTGWGCRCGICTAAAAAGYYGRKDLREKAEAAREAEAGR